MGEQATQGPTFWKEIILPTVTVLLAAIAAWQTYVTGKLEGQTQTQKHQFEQQMEVQREQRVSTEGQQAFMLKVFEYVEKTISAERMDRRREEAALALVRTLPDSESKLALVKILETGSQDAVVRRQASQEAFALLDQNPALNSVPSAASVPVATPAGDAPEPRSAAPSPWAQWDVDLFWCVESGPQAKLVADGVATSLLRQGAQGRIRVRELPAWKNNQPGYGYQGLVVAYNKGAEDAVAARLQGVFADTGSRAILRPVRSPTQWYVSAFVCPPRIPGAGEAG